MPRAPWSPPPGTRSLRSTCAPAPNRSRRWPCWGWTWNASSASASSPWPARPAPIRASRSTSPRSARCSPPPAAEAPAAVYHNCSGKHAYMLAGAVARGWEIERYIEPEHPLQAVVSDTVADFAGAAIEHVGVDGCGVPVHVLPLRALATAYARIGHRAAAGGGPAAALVEAARRH